MQNAPKKILFTLLGILTFSAISVKTIQLTVSINAHYGSNVDLALYILCALIMIICAAASFTAKNCERSFLNEKSKALSFSCYLAGASLFSDFIHQCLNCYCYISENSELQLNYLIPLALVGLSALASAYYYYIFGSSFRSDTYDFKQLKYFHFMPASWIFFRLLTCIVTYTDKSVGAEALLQYAVLIFGIAFYLLFVKLIADDGFKLQGLAFTGLMYCAFSIIISFPRIIAWLLGKAAASVTFTSAAYFFTGIFAFVFVFKLLKPKEGIEDVY